MVKVMFLVITPACVLQATRGQSHPEVFRRRRRVSFTINMATATRIIQRLRNLLSGVRNKTLLGSVGEGIRSWGRSQNKCGHLPGRDGGLWTGRGGGVDRLLNVGQVKGGVWITHTHTQSLSLFQHDLQAKLQLRYEEIAKRWDSFWCLRCVKDGPVVAR